LIKAVLARQTDSSRGRSRGYLTKLADSGLAALRTELSEPSCEVEPSSAIAAAMGGMTGIVRERMREFGSAGQTQPRP